MHRTSKRRAVHGTLVAPFQRMSSETSPWSGFPCTTVTSFNAADVGSYQIVGTKGDLRVHPAYEHVDALGYEPTIKGKTTRARGRDSRAPA